MPPVIDPALAGIDDADLEPLHNCAFCADRAVAWCAWKVSRPTPIRAAELQFGDILWFEPNIIAGPVVDIQAWGRGLLKITWQDLRGRTSGTLGRHVTAQVLVDRPAPCGSACCPAHRRELADDLHYCHEHWHAWESVR